MFRFARKHKRQVAAETTSAPPRGTARNNKQGDTLVERAALTWTSRRSKILEWKLATCTGSRGESLSTGKKSNTKDSDRSMQLKPAEVRAQ